MLNELKFNIQNLNIISHEILLTGSSKTGASGFSLEGLKSTSSLDTEMATIFVAMAMSSAPVFSSSDVAWNGPRSRDSFGLVLNPSLGPENRARCRGETNYKLRYIEIEYHIHQNQTPQR